MMNILKVKKLFLAALIILLNAAICEAQTFDRSPAPKQNKSIAGKGPLKQKTVKVKGPKAAEKAKKEQAAKKKKQDKDYDKFVRNNQKRSIEIQTPEVKERMKQNIKNANSNYKAKQKSSASRTKTGGRKYK